MSRLGLPAALLAFSLTACRSAAPSEDTRARDAPPAWQRALPGLQTSAELDDAAALLCSRDTDGVIDDDVRTSAGVLDGGAFGLLEKGAREDESMAKLLAGAKRVVAERGLTHAGVVSGIVNGVPCAAFVGVRRLVHVVTPPRARLGARDAQHLQVRLPEGKRARLYALQPNGFVQRMELEATNAGSANADVGSAGGEGRYVLELLVDDEEGSSNPEVALWWPYVVGVERAPPFPEVLFPDEGHSDVALSHRAEALVQRLRNEQLLEPFKVSPPLLEVASVRAAALAQHARLDHRLSVPGGTAHDVLEELQTRFADAPRAQFIRVAELQAQASTLAEVWTALLDSPAHRYELVDAGFTHCGVVVTRGHDALGRGTLSLVIVLGRRPPVREQDATRALVVNEANAIRQSRGLEPLVESPHLHRLAGRLALAMKDAQRVDPMLLGEPVAQVAMASDASLKNVVVHTWRVNDAWSPLRPPLPVLLEMDVRQVGVGVAYAPSEGVFYVVALASE